ncbi:proton channel OtopLc [Galendromus occidentalis]|uniref:Proton channel OtopLc n=1 Tax=Galendromus occidentalis TaxID=34638 RepID=A0AAJ7WI98_9ACAR|nr:proton channel OtopLc [Galendromus occidentalis]
MHGPKVIPVLPTPRSVSMILPSKGESGGDSTDEQEYEAQTTDALISNSGVAVGQRASDDSGIGPNEGRSKRSLHIDISPRPAISRASSYGGSVSSLPITPKIAGVRHVGPSDRDSLVIILSALYAKLLIVLGICFPMAEVISRRIPAVFYEGFYLYLYLGSILFLLFMYLFVFPHQKGSKGRSNSRISGVTQTVMDKFRIFTKTKATEKTNRMPAYELRMSHAGSFYLRLGAVAFGTGSMIYSGLEFGQFFEYESTDQCSILHNLTPASRMAFTFFQLYFIFINSRVAINRYTTIARFGLMHMISSNLCVWLHVLIQETKHQIFDLASSPSVENHTEIIEQIVEAVHNRSKRSFPDIYCGQRDNIMGELVQNASPFLFPCTIEYSLICAGVLYIMWKNVGSSRVVFNDSSSATTYGGGKQRHYYQVDCAKANKGLFTGLLVLVLSIISLILFFVLINKPGYRSIAVLEAHIAELLVYVLASLATITALIQVRELRYNRSRNLDLESILLIVAQSGLYLYNVFSIIGGHFDGGESTMLAILTALACLIQASLQTMFILDASRRYVNSQDQAERKPGREMVTFLILCNFSMWAINTLETRRADSNPVQMHFYGFWAWTIITHVTAPLVIFFRFHSTVCLCDIWKRAYKVKSDYLC